MKPDQPALRERRILAEGIQALVDGGILPDYFDEPLESDGDLGMDSVSLVNLTCQIESSENIVLDERMIARATTWADLIDVIHDALRERSGADSVRCPEFGQSSSLQ